MITEFPSKQELHDNGYVSVIDIEKLLCEKLGKEWNPSGMSIESLIDELVGDTKNVKRYYAKYTTK